MTKIAKAVLSILLLTLGVPTMAADTPVKVTNVLTAKKAWDGSALSGYTSSAPQLLLNHFTIKPGAKTSIHLHPANGAGYIVSGELTMYATTEPNGNFDDKSKIKKVVLKPGDAWAENVNVWHYGENNGDEDVTFVVVFATEEGVPATLSLVSNES